MTLVIVAILMVALFGMLTLVVDVGGLLAKRRSMVNAADAAALAAAESCVGGSSMGDPSTIADQYAKQNTPDINSGGIVPGETVGCPPVTSASATGSGYVTVSYTAPEQIFFGPVIGTASTQNVVGKATAAWGALSSGYPVPIMLDAGQVQGTCKIPDPTSIDKECAFWYNNGGGSLGNSSWGYLNLDQWNVATDASCPNSGSSKRKEYIQNGYPSPRPLKGTPAGTSPTYVCVDSGHSAANWSDLAGEEGKIKVFPVNDCNGQVDKSGVLVPCGDPSTPDKYDIVGFTSLLVEHVYHGNDPAAIGSFGANGTCIFSPPNLGTGFTTTLTSILSSSPNTSGCPTSSPPLSGIDPASVSVQLPGPGGGTTVPCGATGQCIYDPSTGVLTWNGAPQKNASIRFDWAFSNTTGACGTRPSDPNAICLVTVYKGFTTSGGSVGGGTNFGAIGIRLCDLTLVASCPK